MKRQAGVALTVFIGLLSTSRDAYSAWPCTTAPLVHFDGARTYKDGNVPTGVAIGDFNHDGTLDLATSENAAGAQGVGFLKGLGGPGWTFNSPATNFNAGLPVGAQALSIATADFDHDGIPDTVITDSTGMVWVSLGVHNQNAFNNAHNFATGHGVPGGAWATDVAVGDFNNPADLWADITTADGVNQTASVLVNNKGHPAFLAFTDYAAGDIPVDGVVVGDFNCDGFPDIAVIDHTASEVDVYTNTTLLNGVVSFAAAIRIDLKNGNNPNGFSGGIGLTQGIFSHPAVPPNPQGPDIAVALNNGQVAVVYNNQRTAAVGHPATCGQWQDKVTNLFNVQALGANGTAQSIIAVDVDGDGLLDLAMGESKACGFGCFGQLGVIRATGTGAVYPFQGIWAVDVVTFPAVDMAAAPTANGIAVGDLNGDHMPDIVLTNGGANSNVDVFLDACH